MGEHNAVLAVSATCTDAFV